MATVITRTTSEIVAANVRRLRALRGWNQSELAKKMGLPQPRISEIECGHHGIKAELIDQLANAFGVTQAALFTDFDES